MIFDDKHLTPAPKYEAGPSNYTWHDGNGPYPSGAAFVFNTRESIAEQIYKDYPDGTPTCIMGHEYLVGQNTVIGGDGFGWYQWGIYKKRFPHIGGVYIGDHVEIGSCVTIDRGALGDTIISDGVKIDNGVHIGHNATIREGTLLAAHCVIGGSAVIGKDVWVGLGAQIKDYVKVGNRAVVGMGAIVIRDVEPDTVVVGNPARELK